MDDPMEFPTPTTRSLQQQSDRPPHNTRAQPLQIVTAGQSHLPQILRMQRQSSNEVGFLPVRAIIEHLNAMHVRIVTLDQNPIGYLLGRHSLTWQPDLSSITQIAVDRCCRQNHIGSMLLADHIATAAAFGRVGVQACCLSHLPANAFWQSHGFVNICYMSPANARRRDVICWRLPLTRKIPLWFAAPPKRSGHHAQRPTINVRQKRRSHASTHSQPRQDHR